MHHHGHSRQDVAERAERVDDAADTRPMDHGSGHDAGHGAYDMAGGDHDRHAGHSVAMFRDKFWLSLALTVPVVLASHDIATWFGYMLPEIPGLDVLPAIIGTVIFVYGGL